MLDEVVIVSNAALTIKLIDFSIIKGERARGDSIFGATPERFEKKLRALDYSDDYIDRVMETIKSFWKEVM